MFLLSDVVIFLAGMILGWALAHPKFRSTVEKDAAELKQAAEKAVEKK